MTGASPTTPFGTQLIGQTEKALNAILDQQLAGTDLTEPLWVTLTVLVVGGGKIGREQLVSRVAHALKVSDGTVSEHLRELASAHLVEDGDGANVEVTEAGKKQWTAIRSAVTDITERLWGDLPDQDIATAGRVLNTILTRLNAILARP